MGILSIGTDLTMLNGYVYTYDSLSLTCHIQCYCEVNTHRWLYILNCMLLGCLLPTFFSETNMKNSAARNMYVFLSHGTASTRICFYKTFADPPLSPTVKHTLQITHTLLDSKHFSLAQTTCSVLDNTWLGSCLPFQR